jgi:MFS family permease
MSFAGSSPGTPILDDPAVPNRLKPMQFVLAFGVVSMLGDFVYEGARSVTGPFLATFGASAALVGFITGAGEAVALVFRLGSGALSDRTGRQWAISISGYALTMVSVPLMAAAWTLWPAAALVISERFGKAVRAPARDTMLAQASVDIGRGRAFAIHEALDQSGAFIGPLVVAAAIALGGGYRWGFGVLAVPGAAAIVVLLLLRRAVPSPAAYEHAAQRRTREPIEPSRLPARFWWYAGYTALNMTGFATFAVLAYHLQVRHVVAPAVIPIVYAVAMGLAAAGALISGWLYDRVGLRGLVVVPFFTAVVPFLSFSTTPALIWAGAAVWGIGLGMHESTMRAAVADLVPASRRGTGYGTFTAIYGLAWMGGGTAIGALYGHSAGSVQAFVVITQAVALAAFLPVALQPRT